MNSYMKALGGLLPACALAACGGGGGSPGTTLPSNTPVVTTSTPSTGTVTAAATPAALEVFTSAPELSSAPNSSVTFNVAVKDASNQAIPNQVVTFSASSGNLTGALPAPATGAIG